MAVEKISFRSAIERLEELRPKLADLQSLDTRAAKCQEPDESSTPTENPPFKGSYEKVYVPSPWLSERGFSRSRRIGVLLALNRQVRREWQQKEKQHDAGGAVRIRAATHR
jgi:hypothetical protein